MPRILSAILITLIAVTGARAAPHLAIDLGSGRVLSHERAFDAWHPASLTKLMTALVVFRALESGELKPNAPVRVSKNARNQPPSRMGYRPGTVMTIENALPLLIVKSANDISVAIAESVAGSVERFAERMNREAARLGMTGSRFVNPHGLHDSRQVTTARDMALLVRAIHRDFPQYRELFRTPSVLAPQRTKKGKIIQRIYYSYNLLLERFRGGDGFKTGFVCASGYNFIGAATRSDRRIAAIVLGRDSQTSRAVDAARLITEGFQLPNDAGIPLSELKPTAAAVFTPRNMRPQMCSEAARAARYEPGAGQAVIDSPWLLPRKVEASPIKVVLGGAEGIPASARLRNTPLPRFRPSLPSAPEVAAEIAASPAAAEVDTRVAIGVTRPTFRPGS